MPRVLHSCAPYTTSALSSKRGGDALHIPLDSDPASENREPVDLMAFDEALDALSRIDPRKAALVEQHCFGGLTIEESAALLGVSPETAKRDWKFSKAWLRCQLAPRT
jgi:RNA polymerase sigma-70 factor, ECF subfamily